MKKKFLPLSDVQRSYLYGRSKNTFLGGVSTHFYIEYSTSLDRERLERALNCTIKEQPSLRSYVTNNGMQCFMDEVPHYTIKETDLSSLSEKQKEEKILEIRKYYSGRMFELNEWPMFEFSMYKLSDTENILIIDSDMMIMDGLSTELMIENLYKYYETDEEVRAIPLSAFENYILYKEKRADKNYGSDKTFWNSVIEKLPSGPQFESGKGVEDCSFSTSETGISKEKWDKIKSRLASERILPSVYLTAAYAKLLSRWCGQSSITLNMTVSNRKSGSRELIGAIGDFTEVMLVDFDFSDGKTLKEKAIETQKKISKRKKHNSVSSSEIIRDYTASHGCDNSFPFPAVCTCMLFDVAGSKWEWMGERRYQISQTPQIMLDNQISLKAGRLIIHWDYLAAYFSDEKIRNMQEEYCGIITGETGALQEKYNRNAENYNKTFRERDKTTLVRLFKEKAKLFSEKTAVSDVSGRCTFEELDRNSDIIADYIAESCSNNCPIIVKMTRHVLAAYAIMGIIKSGGYYIPVAHNCPEQRLEFIAAQSGSSLILSDEKVSEILRNRKWNRTIDLSEPDNIAYVIYTSGSTGNPKGVVITHDCVCNTILDINERFLMTEKDKLIGISSFSFDLSVYDIFGALSSGAEVKLAPSAYDMHMIKKIMANESITVWNTVPSIMELFINNIDKNFMNYTLRTVMLSGDWIPLNLPDRIRKHFPNAEVYSLGGATEASIWSVYYPIETVERGWNSIPYGYPLENQSIWILDDGGNICPPGVRGEICIGGRGVAKGYLNDRERTEKQFFIHDRLGCLYKTGDLGLLSERGWVVFLGRKDFQVKLHGYRIELGEIESCLSQCENVSEAVAEVKEVNGSQKLFAYVTPLHSGKFSPRGEDYISKAIGRQYAVIGITNESFEQIQLCLDEISLGIMEKVFSDLNAGNIFSIDSLMDRNGIDPKFRKILMQWADSLVESEFFEKSGDAYVLTGKHTEASRINELEFEEMKYWKSALGFLSSCEERITDVINGNINSLTLLFKDGKSDIADNLYGNNPVSDYYNNIVAETVKSFIENFPKKHTVRILEVGAGVGATTKPVLEKIKGMDYTYKFTDMSVFFHDIAKEKLSSFPEVKYEILDIDKSVIGQGYKPGSYDLIIAANVIHDSCDAGEALKNLRTLLSNNGAVVILEVTRSRHFHKISMGLTDSYSAYTDKLRLEQNSPLLSSGQWEKLLSGAGYGSVSVISGNGDFDGGQSVITAVSGKRYVYPEIDDMYEALNRRVMNYMIPDEIIIMEEFPYTSNKKVNRKLLPIIKTTVGEAEVYEAPETETEIMLSKVIEEVIEVGNVGVTSNLINAGIDSLRGITFITKLQDKGFNIGLSELYANPTIRDLGKLIDETGNEDIEFGEI